MELKDRAPVTNLLDLPMVTLAPWIFLLALAVPTFFYGS